MAVGRIIEAHRTNYTVKTDNEVLLATVRGTFHEEGTFPKVGDYVELELLEAGKAVIEKVQSRNSVIKRRSADSDEEQVIVANVDLIIIVMGLDGDYNLSRLERYLLLAEQSEVKPVVVLNKTDIAVDLDQCVSEVTEIAGSVPVFSVSGLTGDGMDTLLDYLKTDMTAVLLGSSGAGKSTITNWLLREEKQAVNKIREDDSRGRHTTTSRQLFALPNGAFLIDTPGMRELGVIESDTEDELAVFERIEKLAENCRFRNCDHERSAGCAVLEAIAIGELNQRELDNYHKLLREREFQDSKYSTNAMRHRVQNEKRLSQKIEAIKRQRLSGR
ncbi:ribosome small subunit-dependent GTPase A [Candidatus Kaiserbacteria bacterium]|nr:ribosome small subunit-dependent GTPase A [Candidatus Kaiserbacteria bacterium]